MGTYEELRGLEHLYLEDSYVLAVTESVQELRFEVEAVLTEAHPRFTTPQPGEVYTYLRVAIVFPRPRSVSWIRRQMRRVVDANGNADYGNVDTFTFEGDRYELAGDWGEVVVEGPAPTVTELG